MGTRGDLLALVDSAPGRLRTLQGALTTWTDRDLAAAVHQRTEALAADAHDDDADALAPVALLPTAGWHPAERRPRAGRAGGDVDLGTDEAADHPRASGGDAAETLVGTYVVVALPDRWRVVGRGHIAVSDGRRSWVGTSTLVTERDSARAAIHDAGGIGACLYPGALLGGLELSTPDAAEIEGRACWVVDAQPRSDVTGTTLAASAAPGAVRLHRDLVGLDHRIWFDAATGILLRHEGYVDGEPCSWTSLTDLVFDAAIDDGEFRPPPGAVVRSRHELLRDHLSEIGVDPDTIDLDDPAQVRDALRHGG